MLLRYSQNRKVWQAEHLQTGNNKNSSLYVKYRNNWRAAHWIPLNHTTETVSLATPANKERKEMLFAFDLRNFTLVKAIFFYFNFSAQEIELHFSFPSNFLICYIPPPVLSCIFFYSRKVARIISSFFFWSLFCLLTLKLCFSNLTAC